MPSLRRIQREMGQLGHLGEFFLGLGLFILVGGLAVLGWGWWGAPESAQVDASTSGWLFVVAGVGVSTFGAYTIFSGWGRHHPHFEAGGDPAVADVYDKEGR